MSASAEVREFTAIHRPQLPTLPDHLWPVLHHKLTAEEFDADSAFVFGLDGGNDLGQHYFVAGGRELEAGEDVWLVGHCVICERVEDLLARIQAVPALRDRVAAICEHDLCEEEEAAAAASDKRIEHIQCALHRYVFELELRTSADSPGTKYRYVMDELGSRVRVSAAPNACLLPFVWARPGAALRTYSVLWLTAPVREGEEVTRGPLGLGLGDYSARDFWSCRYQGDATVSEWYCDSAALVRALTEQCPVSVGDGADTPSGSTTSVLVAGCGNSSLGYELWQVGYRPVVNVDYVPSVIAAMAERYGTAAGRAPRLRYAVGDLCDLAEWPAGHFGLVVDKATLDALLTRPAGHGGGKWREKEEELQEVFAYLRELLRLLAPAGRVALVSIRDRAYLEGLWRAAVAGAPSPTAVAVSEPVPLPHNGTQALPVRLFWCCPVAPGG